MANSSEPISPLGSLLERQTVAIRLAQAQKVLANPSGYSKDQVRRATAAVVRFSRSEA